MARFTFSSLDGASRSAGDSNPVDDDVFEFKLIEDQATLSELSAMARAKGGMLICHRCSDLTGVIAGIVVIPANEEAWVLCGPCLRQMPRGRQLAS
jgi:hypothetical protein